MTKLLENALQTVDPQPVLLAPPEREAIARSKAAAERGEFATDEQVRAVWSSRGL
jgi:predicted transcriptional regulator